MAAVANLDVFSGDFNPNFFNYPSAFLYATYFVHTLASGWGWTQEVTRSNAMWALPHDIIWCARLVSATLGALTASVVFLLAREVFGRNSHGAKWAIVAGLLCAFAPAHVQHSHFATVDIAATFWVAMTLWLSCRALNFCSRNIDNFDDDNSKNEDETTDESSEETKLRLKADAKRQRRVLLLAALCAGIGAATKYNAVIVLIAPLVATLYIEYSKLGKVKLLLGVFVVAVLGFLLGCPFSVLAPREFWGDGVNTGFAYELLVHPRQGSGDLFTQTGNGWLYHATFNLPFALTAPFAMAAFLGLLLSVEGIVKTRKIGLGGGRVLVPMVAFSLLYFFALGFSQVRFMRYTLLLLPTFAIFAALFIRAFIEALQTRNRFTKLATGAILPAICATGTLNVLSPLTQTDPRDAAKNYLDAQNVSPPISVGLADAQNPLWFTTPPLWPQDTPPGTGRNLLNVQRNARYELRPIGADAAKLQAERPQNFVWSEFQWREGERLNDANLRKLRAALNIEYSMREFHNAVPLELPGRDYAPHDFLYTNPRVEVWTRK